MIQSFNSIAVDSIGDIYAAGYIYGTGTYDFGNSQTVTGTYSIGNNILLVKYNSAGVAQWARTVFSGTSNSGFTSVCVDGNGDIYAAGYINGNGLFTFGGQNAQSPVVANNIVLVKYDSFGAAQWAKTVVSGPDESYFTSVSAAAAVMYTQSGI